MTDAAIGPDSLTMAIALGGRPEDKAKMVWSRGCIAYFFQQIVKGNPASLSQAGRDMLHRNITAALRYPRSNLLHQSRVKSRYEV